MANEDLLWEHPLVARLIRGGRRLRQDHRSRPWLLNTGLVVLVLLLFGLPDLLHRGDRDELVRVTDFPVVGAVALQLGLALPLLWRRSRPVTVFAAVMTVFLLQWSMDVWLHIDIALFIALYGVARRGGLRYLPWVCGVTVAAMVLVVLRVSTVASPFEAMFFLCSAATAAVALGLGVRIGQAHLGALRERAARLERERDQQNRLAAAAERARVAREMHDIIGHNLSVIIGLADGGAYAADVVPERSKEALQLIAGTSRQALGELRRMLGVLREEPGPGPQGPELSPQPGIADLEALCERVRVAGPEVAYRTAGDLDTLNEGVQLTVYRIAQESLTNALKHAGPDTRTFLTVAADAGGIRIRVEDTGPADGRTVPAGPDTGHTDVGRSWPSGQGIAGMAERAALYGGTVTAGPRPGGGWAVETRLDPAPPPAVPARLHRCEAS
ncbi:histidine kinase [Streptomyces sp. NBC_00466]|uniref:sensor histidine kinase n=1 Tax=Streptomyces sp. NBC_00466 TaxID=2903655 RepID=UPI0030E5CFBF